MVRLLGYLANIVIEVYASKKSKHLAKLTKLVKIFRQSYIGHCLLHTFR